MNMDKKHQLHTGIKDIIQANGVEPIRNIQLANILADYSAYDEYPATKIVLKDVLTNGFGQKIYDAFNKSGKSSLAEIEKIKHDYSKTTKFKKDVVNYVFDSICYGLGLKTSVKEPSSNSFDPFKNESDNILDKLPGMLAELKKRIRRSLENSSGTAKGYYLGCSGLLSSISRKPTVFDRGQDSCYQQSVRHQR